jgi:hypothetical protein
LLEIARIILPVNAFARLRKKKKTGPAARGPNGMIWNLTVSLAHAKNTTSPTINTPSRNMPPTRRFETLRECGAGFIPESKFPLCAAGHKD